MAWTRHQRSAVVAACSVAYAALAARAARSPQAWEMRLFGGLNGLPTTPAHRVPQQLGTPWTLPAVAAVAVARRRGRDAVAAILALGVIKAAELSTKAVVRRRRPARCQPTRLRDDAPVEGGSYPSGHAATAAASAVLLAPCLEPRARWALVALVAATAHVRVQQGAHYPTDIVGGVLLGTAVAAALSGAAERAPGPDRGPRSAASR